MNASNIVPGAYRCPKCAFELVKNTLYVQSGTMGPTISNVVERCPNDETRLVPVTWQARCEELAKVCENQVQRACKAEEDTRRLDWLESKPLGFSLIVSEGKAREAIDAMMEKER